jgi:hypothetical protein
MAAESEEREQRQKGESARRGRTPVKPRQRITTAGEGSRPTHARERPAHMAVIDRFLAKQHGTSLRAASSGARGVHLSVRVTVHPAASFHSGRPSRDPAAKKNSDDMADSFLKSGPGFHCI